MDRPPLDPDDWTDEQWRAHLEAMAEQGSDDTDDVNAGERGATTFRRVASSGLGAVMGAGMLGLERAFYGVREQETIVAEADDDDPDRDLSTFDPDDPASSVISLAPAPPDEPGPVRPVEPTRPSGPDGSGGRDGR